MAGERSGGVRASFPRLLIVVGALYALGHVLFIVFFASPVPYWDEWDHLVLFSTDLARQTSVAGALEQFWIPDSVHRVPVLKAIYLALIGLPAPPKWMMFMSLLLMLAMFAALWIWYLRHELRTREDQLLAALLFLFFTSWNQSEVLFMGISLAWFITNAAFLLAFRAVTERRYALALVPLLVSALSLGTWVFAAGTIGIYFCIHALRAKETRSRTHHLALGGALAMLTVGLYAILRFTGTPPVGSHLTPAKFVGFLITTLGSPFLTMGVFVSITTGVAFLGFLIWVIANRARRERLKQPYLVLYGIIGALLVTIGRGGDWKFPDSVGYRYSTFMVISWIFVFLTIWKWSAAGSKARKLVITWLVISTCVCDTKQFWRQWESADSYTYAGRLLLRLNDAPTTVPTARERVLIENIYPSVDRVRDIVRQGGPAIARLRRDLEGSTAEPWP